MTTPADLDTPCLVIDLEILEENLKRMQVGAAAAGKTLRPHAKTHKCSTIAKMQMAAGAAGVCVAKISEAEGLVAAGVPHVLITGAPAAERKAARLTALLERSASVMAVVDHPENIALLEKHLANAGRTLDVLVDIDVGSRRTGASPESAAALAGRVLESRHITLKGIQAYAGHVQHIQNYRERQTASVDSLKRAARVFTALKSKAPSCTIFSGTGTGTHDIDLAVPELTELQVGSYVLMDAEYGTIESADSSRLDAKFRPALTLLATVINANHDTHVTIDAGLKSLYRDGSRPRVVTPGYAGLRYDWFGDEYGRLTPEDQTASLPRLGETIELVVSHCDPTVNQFDRFHILRRGEVVDTWPIDLRGKSQ